MVYILNGSTYLRRCLDWPTVSSYWSADLPASSITAGPPNNHSIQQSLLITMNMVVAFFNTLKCLRTLGLILIFFTIIIKQNNDVQLIF